GAPRAGPSEDVDSVPLGSEYRPHQDTYKPSPNPQADTVIANERCSSPSGPPVPGQATPVQPAGPQKTKRGKPVRIDGTVLRLSTDELVRLAPRLRPYLTTPQAGW